MMLELHFYAAGALVPEGTTCLHGVYETDAAVVLGDGAVHTTQACVLDDATRILEAGGRVFVHDFCTDGVTPDTYELKLGACPRTDKEIRVAHNLFRVWRNGGFDRADPACQDDI